MKSDQAGQDEVQIREEMTSIIAKKVSAFNSIDWIRYEIAEWDLKVEYGNFGKVTGVYLPDRLEKSNGWMGFVTIKKVRDKWMHQVLPASSMQSPSFAPYLDLLLRSPRIPSPHNIERVHPYRFRTELQDKIMEVQNG